LPSRLPRRGRTGPAGAERGRRVGAGRRGVSLVAGRGQVVGLAGAQQPGAPVNDEGESDQRGHRDHAHDDHQRECGSAVQVAHPLARGLARSGARLGACATHTPLARGTQHLGHQARAT
jgi:hypothetical protein